MGEYTSLNMMEPGQARSWTENSQQKNSQQIIRYKNSPNFGRKRDSDLKKGDATKALNRFFLSFDDIDNKVKNLVKIDLSDKIR